MWENKGGDIYQNLPHYTRLSKIYFPSRNNLMFSFRAKQSKPNVKDQAKIFAQFYFAAYVLQVYEVNSHS